MIRLETISSDKKTVLYNFLQKYLYELSQYYYNEMNEEGNFVYKYFPNYFTDPDRYAYFICDDDKYIGFVLINVFFNTVRPRIDEYLYDIDCANEALVNMFVHNDWTITEPQVSFYSDRIVFTSHGGIPHGMTEEEFYSGVSRPRNAVLMRVFLNLGIVEHTGHGIPMIVEKYGREAFDIHQNYIDVTLPFSQAVLASVPQLGTNHGTGDKGIRLNEDLSGTEKKLILELIKNPKYTYNQLASEIGISRRTVSRTVASLVEKKYIERIGNHKSGFWKIIR